MACCKCCCVVGAYPGVCCGNPASCCRAPKKCCGGQACCDENKRCCAPSCCSSTQCCVDGECVTCSCSPPCSTKACKRCTEVSSGVYECVSDCVSGQCCVDGTCQTCPPQTCPDTACDSGKCCVDGRCVTCPPNDCSGDPCDEGECCVDGVCEPCVECSPGDCGEGQCCVDGSCMDCPPEECPDSPCPEGLCCVDGHCAPCPCDPACSGCSECVDGGCVTTCAEGEYCCDGVCQAEPCVPPCDPACDGCSDCIDGDCVSSCGPGQYCCNGVCQDYPCLSCGPCNQLTLNDDAGCPFTDTTPAEPIPCTYSADVVVPCACDEASVFIESCGSRWFRDSVPAEFHSCSCASATSYCATYEQIGTGDPGFCTCERNAYYNHYRHFIFIFNLDSCQWEKYAETSVTNPSPCAEGGGVGCECPEVRTCTPPDCGPLGGCVCANEFP